MSDSRRTPSKLSYDQSGQALQRAARPDEAMVRIKEHRAFLDARLTRIGEWVTAGIKPQDLVRFALADMSAPGRAGDLLRACTQESIYLGLLACATTGLVPGALRGEAYLVPYAGTATFIPGWKGLVKQARRSREVLRIDANVVRERDVFELDLGTDHRVVHRPALRDRGEVVGAYAIAKLTNSEVEIEWMDREDLDAVRNAATKGGKFVSPAYADWEDQMQRKAPIRRLCKRLPLGHDYFVALALERAADAGESQRPIIDLETSGEARAAEQAGAGAGEMSAQVRDIASDEAAAIAAEEARAAQGGGLEA